MKSFYCRNNTSVLLERIFLNERGVQSGEGKLSLQSHTSERIPVKGVNNLISQMWTRGSREVKSVILWQSRNRGPWPLRPMLFPPIPLWRRPLPAPQAVRNFSMLLTRRWLTHFSWISKGDQHTSLEAWSHTSKPILRDYRKHLLWLISLPPLWLLYPSLSHHKTSLFWARFPEVTDSQLGKQNWACVIPVGQLGPRSRAPAAMLKDAVAKGKRIRQVELKSPSRAHYAFLRVLQRDFSLFPNIRGDSSLPRVVISFYHTQSGEGVVSGELNILDSQVLGGIQAQFGYSESLSTTLEKRRFMLQDVFCFV